MDKKTLLTVSPILFLVAFGSAFLITPGTKIAVKKAQETSSTSSVAQSSASTTDSDPKTQECPMNGAMYSEKKKVAWQTRRPIGVMVENTTEARPQSGLSSADIIYETSVEGGITRFMGVFYCNYPELIGPVRSARMPYLRMIKEYGQNPLYAHVGGANAPGPADALGAIKKLGWTGYNDVDQFAVPFPVYYRDYDRLPNVATEHTVYMRPDKMQKFVADKRQLTNVDAKGVAWDTGFTKWKFQDGAADSARTAKKINYVFRNTSLVNDMAVQWDYDANTNTYKRTNGGKEHIDNNTKKQWETSNIAIMYAKETEVSDQYSEENHGKHVIYEVKGTGKAVIFQNGKQIKGTWSKAADESRTKFTDDKGKEIEFVRGQIYIAILATDNSSLKSE